MFTLGFFANKELPCFSFAVKEVAFNLFFIAAMFLDISFSLGFPVNKFVNNLLSLMMKIGLKNIKLNNNNNPSTTAYPEFDIL